MEKKPPDPDFPNRRFSSHESPPPMLSPRCSKVSLDDLADEFFSVKDSRTRLMFPAPMEKCHSGRRSSTAPYAREAWSSGQYERCIPWLSTLPEAGEYGVLSCIECMRHLDGGGRLGGGPMQSKYSVDGCGGVGGAATPSSRLAIWVGYVRVPPTPARWWSLPGCGMLDLKLAPAWGSTGAAGNEEVAKHGPALGEKAMEQCRGVDDMHKIIGDSCASSHDGGGGGLSWSLWWGQWPSIDDTTVRRDGPATGEVVMERCASVEDCCTGGTRGRGRSKRCSSGDRRYVGVGISVCERAAGGVDLHNIIGDGGGNNNDGHDSDFHWSLQQGWGRPPSMTMASRSMARRSMGTTTHLQARQRVCRHGGGGNVRQLLMAQRRFSSRARATAIVRGRSKHHQQSLAPMGNNTDGSPAASSTGAAAPTARGIQKSDSRPCGVAAVSFAPIHGRPPDGLTMV